MRLAMSVWFLLGFLLVGVMGVWGAQDALPMYTVVQRASRDGTTRSVTFLSSGYTKAEADRFANDVRVCLDALHNRVADVTAGPWARYAMLLNVYSVFQPLNENDAGELDETSHLCSYGATCSSDDGSNKNDCFFGSHEPSIIKCDLSAVFTLATAAPVRDLLVVLVNAPTEIVSAGGNAFAVLTNNPLFMPFFVIRELSKAIAHLSGEYSRGVNADHTVRVPNCVSSLDEAQSEWGYWMDQGVVDKTPQRGCFFNNYYRPTSAGCMMRNSSVNGMCAVCSEKVNLALLCSDMPVSLASTRCPREGHTVHVDVLNDLRLTVGDFGLQSGVVVTWQQEDGTPIMSNGNDAASLVVSTDTLKTWRFPTVVRAIIEDSSPYTRPNSCREKSRTRTEFSLVSKTTSVCTPTSCGSFSVCTSCTGSNCTVDIPPHTEEVEWAVEKGLITSGWKTLIISLVFSVSALVVVLLLILYFFCYYRRPHEVLSTTLMDNIVCALLVVLSVFLLLLLSSILILFFNNAEVNLLLWGGFIIPSFLLWIIIVLTAITNLCAALFRCYKIIVGCGVVHFLLGLCLIGIGVFFAWSYVNDERDSSLGYLAARWLAFIRGSPDVVRRIQSHFKCSGFFVACLEVNSSYCPVESESNMYATPCEGHFNKAASNTYIMIGIFATVSGVLMIFLAIFNAVFAVRFTKLSKMGKLRRAYRTDPSPPILPFTFNELREARRIFEVAGKRKGRTLEGRQASSFLKRVFNVKLDQHSRDIVESKGPLTFDELMQLCFPYFITSQMDPRQLIPDEMAELKGIVEIQRAQYEKLEKFALASGVLSPEALCMIFQLHTRDRFGIDQKELLSSIEKSTSSSSDDTLLCTGLSEFELEGLRSMWVRLNPRVVGILNDEQLSLFFLWTHGEPLRDPEHLERWKQSLDVRNRGKIGWGEFCFPFAKRGRLRRARMYLRNRDVNIPPEMLSRHAVIKSFGLSLSKAVFSPYEEEIPIEQLIQHLLQKSEASLGYEEG